MDVIFLSFLITVLFFASVIAYSLIKPKLQISEGAVIQKIHHAECYEEPRVPAIMYHNGRTSQNVSVPLKTRFPETWEIRIKHNFRKASYYVDKETFAEVQIGTRFHLHNSAGSRIRPKEEIGFASFRNGQ